MQMYVAEQVDVDGGERRREGGREEGLNGWRPAATVTLLGLGRLLLLSGPTEVKHLRHHPSNIMHAPRPATIQCSSCSTVQPNASSFRPSRRLFRYLDCHVNFIDPQYLAP